MKENPQVVLLIHLLFGALSVLGSLSVFSQSSNSLHLMEPEVLLPLSQVPSNCPYPETARDSPCPHIQLPEDRSYYYHLISALFSKVTSLPQVSPPQPSIYISPLPHTCFMSLLPKSSRFDHPNNIM
jgi:hypothetical protein